MTRAEAIAKIEAMFTLCSDRGLPNDHIDGSGKVVGTAGHNMEFAPNGEAYFVMSSFGIDPPLPDVDVMFASEGLAFRWLVDEVEDFAASLIGRENWKSLHLYWRVMPEFHKATYLAMDQAGLLQTASPLAAVLTIELGFARAEMLISRVGPDGKED